MDQVLGGEMPRPQALAPLVRPEAANARRKGRIVAFLVACRPRQWVKNLLVLAAPAAAGVLGHLAQLGRTGAALGIFVAVSSGTYLLNDTIDAEADRRHPIKRQRPIAAGELSARAATVAAGALLVAGLLGAAFLAEALGIVVGAYVALTFAYSLLLKRVPYLELACISLAFLLRALGGAAATGVPVSPWFLVVTSAGALLIAAGKRGAELDLLGSAGREHRRSLAAYPRGLLRGIRMAAGAVAVVGYGLWALWRGTEASRAGHEHDVVLLLLSGLPFALAVVLLERLLERGDGGAPEELALRSRPLQVLGLACVALVAAGIYS
jgi:decaprenyl-phosphate phosphoribosyltransferase